MKVLNSYFAQLFGQILLQQSLRHKKNSRCKRTLKELKNKYNFVYLKADFTGKNIEYF